MQRMIFVLALVILAGCDRKVPAPAAPPANPDKPSVELKLDTQKGAIEFKKDEGGGGDKVDVDVKPE